MESEPSNQEKAEMALDAVLENIQLLEDEDVGRAYLRFKEEARHRQHMEQIEDMAEREVSLEKAEGDLLSRRRKCERILGDHHDDVENLDVGDTTTYGSLEVYRGDDYIQVQDVDGVATALIREGELPRDNPDRIEELQQRLDRIHVETLDEL